LAAGSLGRGQNLQSQARDSYKQEAQETVLRKANRHDDFSREGSERAAEVKNENA
jgi:hypothetical protein